MMSESHSNGLISCHEVFIRAYLVGRCRKVSHMKDCKILVKVVIRQAEDHNKPEEYMHCSHGNLLSLDLLFGKKKIDFEASNSAEKRPHIRSRFLARNEANEN